MFNLNKKTYLSILDKLDHYGRTCFNWISVVEHSYSIACLVQTATTPSWECIILTPTIE